MKINKFKIQAADGSYQLFMYTHTEKGVPQYHPASRELSNEHAALNLLTELELAEGYYVEELFMEDGVVIRKS